VRLGDARTRALYAGLVALALVVPLALAVVLGSAWPLLALLGAPLVVPLVRRVLGGARGRGLVPVLAGTGQAQLVVGALLGLGLGLS
jgi:1,4-dihydroxy-2-naphthoate polyprenyltransferase